MKKLLGMLILFVVSLLTVSLASAATMPVQVEQLKINDHVLGVGENCYVEEGENLNIKVKVRNTLTNGTTDDVEVRAAIRGYEYSDYESLEDSSHVFDLDAGDTRWINLNIRLPNRLDKDLYLLRVRVTDKNSDELSYVYNLKINPTRHGVGIKDVLFSPGTTVQAGRSLLTTVLIDNYGARDERDVKVSLEIPELGISISDYINHIDSDDTRTSEELFLRIPQCAAAGDYPVTISLTYDGGYETATQQQVLTVLENERCTTSAGRLILTVGPETQNIVANQQATYPIALTNAGTSARTYVLELTAGEWGAAQLSENLVVLEPGSTQVVYAYLTASEAATAGEKVVTLAVKSGDNVLKMIYLKANVVPQERSFNLRTGIEIALIVLVVILVIVGLIIGFSRLRKDEDEELEEGEDKTYY